MRLRLSVVSRPSLTTELPMVPPYSNCRYLGCDVSLKVKSSHVPAA